MKEKIKKNDKEGLYHYHSEKQGTKCALCNQVLENRYLSHLDRIVRGEDGGEYTQDNTRIICIECDWEREGNKPNSPHPKIMSAYKNYKYYQNEAGRLERQLKAYRGEGRGITASPYITEEFLNGIELRLENHEAERDDAKKILQKLVRKTSEWKDFMKESPALGEILAGYLLGKVKIKTAEHVSSLWKFFGYNPKNSAGQKGRNPGLGSLRAPIYSVLNIFCKRGKADPENHPYRMLYDKFRARELKDSQAVHRVSKIWLSHLWDTWRKYEKLPVTEPYANNHLGHDTLYEAKKFGWK